MTMTFEEFHRGREAERERKQAEEKGRAPKEGGLAEYLNDLARRRRREQDEIDYLLHVAGERDAREAAAKKRDQQIQEEEARGSDPVPREVTEKSWRDLLQGIDEYNN